MVFYGNSNCNFILGCYNARMKKIIIWTANLVISLSLVFLPTTVFATAYNSPSQNIPEIEGTYNEPGHKNVKVHVSVYHAKNTQTKAGSNQAPSLTCNLLDNDSSSIVATAGWKLPASVHYRLNVASVPSTVGSSNLSTIAANSFNSWQIATNDKVSFVRDSDTATNRQAYDGQNIITWGRTSGSALAVTYTRYNTVTKQVLDVDTVFNKSFTWYWSSQSDCAYSGVYDAQDILTHEIGHWMGLSDTYTTGYQENTMYGYGATGEVKKNTLTTGDIQSTQQLY